MKSVVFDTAQMLISMVLKNPVSLQLSLDEVVMEQVFLSRRNLETLLSKLDRVKAGDTSTCTIIKKDNQHPVYPQTMNMLIITAIEDEDYYTDRKPGDIHPKDEK